MRRSQRLRLSDVRRVFQTLGDARELRHDQVRQEVRIVDTMTDLLGASFGFALQFGEFRPKAATHIQRAVPGSTQDPRVVRYLTGWGKRSDFNDDPMMHATWGHDGPVHTTSRSGVMTYEAIKPYRIYEEMVEPAEIRDVLMTFFRYPGTNVTRGYAFQRTVRQEEYEPRDHRLAHLFTTELYRLYREGLLEQPSPMDALAPRLARMARQLMTGRSQRQIALNLNLTYQTVRSYTKELYDTVGVSSREALVAKLADRGGE
jgi:DNA-binding CsgD family transcriptional regulator